jgi:hypothetical protein
VLSCHSILCTRYLEKHVEVDVGAKSVTLPPILAQFEPIFVACWKQQHSARKLIALPVCVRLQRACLLLLFCSSVVESAC